MRLSKLFTKTTKNVSKEETSRNAQLLIRAGYIFKMMAGVYAFTPLGLKVVENIKTIIRDEMNSIDGQELIMTNLQPKQLWEQTNRWDDEIVDIWFKTELKDGKEIGLAWSHEEPIMEMMRQFIKSYKDLPTSVYQFQTKLRNELRAKSGIMRGREFVMKDMYSLHANEEDLQNYYEGVKNAYMNIFHRLEIGEDTFITFASGGAFTQFSHEFQTLCDVGEDVLYVNREKNIAVNEEVLDAALKELDVKKEDMEVLKASEVGNIFNFGTEKSEQMNIQYTDSDGKNQPIYLASYGIGVTRVMGVIVEKFADDRGIVWPESIAPSKVHLICLSKNEDVLEQAEALYKQLQDKNIDVLFDDRPKLGAGQRLGDADLMGMPYRILMSDKSLEAGGVEFTVRKTGESEILSIDAAIEKL
jgi:prolyl-tRNA synthetase